MADNGEIDALVRLLDDTDEEVINNVTNRLLTLGSQVIPTLEEKWYSEQNKLVQERLENIIHQIQVTGTTDSLVEWAKQGGADLFEGAYLVAKFRYPKIERQELSNQLDRMKLDAWLELGYSLSSLEKVKKLNYIIYELHGFKGDNENYHAPDNSFINKVLETKKGNPISLAILYSIVAHRLNIPIFGVNLPQHFVLAYTDDEGIPTANSIEPAETDNLLQPEDSDKVLFYINAFNRGMVFTRNNIMQFLNQLKLDPKPYYFVPCSNVDIIMRVLRNIVFSYEKLDMEDQAQELKKIMKELHPYTTII